VGQAYTLAFKASAFARGSADTQLSAEAFGGSRTDLASTVAVNEGEQFVMNFIASSDRTLLRFSDRTPDTSQDYDIDLDSVEVYQGVLPEDFFG
ncbi:MAG: hypothetical protein AAGB18_07365, partial [Pseudomonadota bacterium]